VATFVPIWLVAIKTATATVQGPVEADAMLTTHAHATNYGSPRRSRSLRSSLTSGRYRPLRLLFRSARTIDRRTISADCSLDRRAGSH
jgi:hypothetical protein